MSSEVLSQSRYWNNEADSFQSIYTRRKSRFANFLDQVFRKDMFERFAFTINHCSPWEGLTFLDVGCGSGQYSIDLARKGARRVVGLDIAENMLQLSRQFADREGVQDRCTFLHTDLLKFRAENPFDVSIGIGLFDYIKDSLPVLKKMKEVSTNRIIVSFPRLWTWRAPIRKIRLTLRGCEVYFYSKRKVRHLLTEAGFTKMEIHKVGKLFCVVGYL